jgi:hypothetical protein
MNSKCWMEVTISDKPVTKVKIFQIILRIHQIQKISNFALG